MGVRVHVWKLVCGPVFLLSAADQGGASRCYDTECPGGDGGGGLALELRCGGSLGEWGVYGGN